MILKTFGAVLIPLWGFSTASSVLFRPLFDGEVNHDGVDSAEAVPDHVPDPGLGRSASGLNCGNPSVGHNAALLAGLPDRTVIDFTEPGYDTGIDRYVTDPSDEGFRIVGGAEAVPHSWPWQVRVRTCSRWRCTYLCGGSLIAPRWAVTASHCVPYRGDRGLITVGAHRLFDDGQQSGAKNYTISKIYNHEKWNKYRRINDITLILTANVIEFNNNVRPICMPQDDVCFNPGTACVVTGWGYKNERGPIAKEMQEVAVRVIDHNTCKAAMWYGGQVYESQVCAGYVDGRQDSCAGDSGGPLVCRLGDNMPWVLYGVVSWGYGCARARKPGVYTKVPHFKDWIAGIMSEASGGKAAVSGKVSGAQFTCATCKDHPMGTCGANINPWFATQPAINTPQTEAATEPPTTTEAATEAPTTTEEPTTTTMPATHQCGGDVDMSSGHRNLYSPNYPNKYDTSKKCDWSIKNNDQWVGIRIEDNQLDTRKWCYRRGDYVFLACGGNRRNYYCSGQTTQTIGMGGTFFCKVSPRVMFSSDSSTVNTGAKISVKVLADAQTNSCGALANLKLDPNDPFAPNVVDLYPMTGMKNKRCRFTAEVPEGKKALFRADTRKMWLTAREKYDRRTRKWSIVRCYDYLNIYEADGTTLIRKVCGRRWFHQNKDTVSSSNKMVVELVTDGRSHRRERVRFAMWQK